VRSVLAGVCGKRLKLVGLAITVARVGSAASAATGPPPRADSLPYRVFSRQRAVGCDVRRLSLDICLLQNQCQVREGNQVSHSELAMVDWMSEFFFREDL